MDTLGKAELTPLDQSYCNIFKIRNTDLQFQSPGYSWQKNEKKKEKNKNKNIDNYKALCVSRKHNNYLMHQNEQVISFL